MTSPSPNYITPKGFARIQAEYRDLLYNERPKLVETVAWAAGNGDRSENGDYIYGKRRLRQIDSRLKFLQNRLESAQVVDPAQQSGDKILFGAIVTLLTEEQDHKVYQIVGEDEIDPAQGLISWKSPLARALLNKKAGDEIQFSKPSGHDFFAEILEVSYR